MEFFKNFYVTKKKKTRNRIQLLIFHFCCCYTLKKNIYKKKLFIINQLGNPEVPFLLFFFSLQIRLCELFENKNQKANKKRKKELEEKKKSKEYEAD